MSADKPSDEELRQRLTALQYHVTREHGTERAFTGIYEHNKEPGVYRCVCCGTELFSSDTKYDSGSGWPSFWLPLAGERVRSLEDRSILGRVLIKCMGALWSARMITAITRLRPWSKPATLPC